MKKAIFGAGCFWGVEAAFRKVPGVTSTRVGYSGGSVPNPTYQQVCTDRTGHAEVVEVTFDPEKVDYESLLQTFWKIHDPTTLNRQGPDVGSQYRSVIFFYGEEQERSARSSLERHQKQLTKEIVTQILPVEEFYQAEDYHQQYLEKRGLGTCSY